MFHGNLPKQQMRTTIAGRGIEAIPSTAEMLDHARHPNRYY